MSKELQEVIQSNPEWYKDLQYKDAKIFIRDNINSTCRSFVAIGYYLKYIRDNQMYSADGYESVWELAQVEYGISKSQASKFMSINDRFSKDGNSPILLDQYKDFSSSKLSEMLYLTDEQMEQVTAGTTVAQIREIRKPEEVVSTSKQEVVIEVEPDLKNSIIRAYINSFTEWKKNGIREAFAKSTGLKERIEYFKSCAGLGGARMFLNGTAKLLYIRKVSEDELEISDWYHDFAEFAPNITRLVFTFGEVVGIADEMLCQLKPGASQAQVQEEEKPSEQCLHRPEYTCTLPEASKLAIGDGIDCNAKCCWGCSKHLHCGYECNSSHHRPEEVKQEFQCFDKLAAYWCKRSMTVELYELAKSNEDEDIDVFNQYFKEKYINGKEICAPAHNTPGYEISFRTDKDGVHFDDKENTGYSWLLLIQLVCQEAENDTPASKPTNFHENSDGLKRLKEIRKELRAGRKIAESATPEPECIEPVIKTTETVIEEPEIVSKQSETVSKEWGAIPDCDTCKWNNSDEECCDYDWTKDGHGCTEGYIKWEPIDPDSVETLEADIIQTEYTTDDSGKESGIEEIIRCTPTRNEDDVDCPAGMGPKRGGCTRTFTNESFDDAIGICKECWDKYLRRLISEDRDRKEPIEIKVSEIIQPELPILRNNDQRKDFIDAYETWPIWIDQKETGERYYRYNLSDKVAMVVKVSLRHGWCEKEALFGNEQYYLLGIQADWTQKGTIFKEDDTRTFADCNTNKSALVEYLKVFQKKGA